MCQSVHCIVNACWAICSSVQVWRHCNIFLTYHHGQEIFQIFTHMKLTNLTLLASKGAARGGEGAQAPPLSDQNIDVYFLSFSPTLYCKSRSGALQNILWQYHRRSNAFVIKPSGLNFRDLRNIETACFIPASFALPYITIAGCCRALPVWKQAWHLNY